MSGDSAQIEHSHLDLLSLPFFEKGIRRTGTVFEVGEPWALARFGQLDLKSGWWRLEFLSPTPVPGLEVRLRSPSDPLVVFPAIDAANRTILLRAVDAYDVAVLISPWPGCYEVPTLSLRRLSLQEEMQLFAAAALRAARGGHMIERMSAVAQRFFAGQSLGLGGKPSVLPQDGLARADASVPKPRGEYRWQQSGETRVFLGLHDNLHPRAFAIAKEALARSPRLVAVYGDLLVGGRLVPRPSWDAVLARHVNYVDAPIFIRNETIAIDSPSVNILAKLAQTHGDEAVSRIPLPLAARSHQYRTPLPPVPVPHLSAAPKVSVIIPTKYRIDLLEKCLEGLHLHTNYPRLQVVIVDNGSEDPRLPPLLERFRHRLDLRRIDEPGAFNFSSLVNAGVSHSDGEITLLLNDDIEPLEPGWLHRLVDSAISPVVGAVGARLVYPDHSIQHAGVMLGLGGVCGHLWKGMSPEQTAEIPQICYPSRRSAVTGACMAFRREHFNQAGGFNLDLPVALNDIDFCLRLRELGYQNIYRGDAVLIHHESQSRGADDVGLAKRRRLASETRIFFERWSKELSDDPFGSPAFDTMREDGTVLAAALDVDGWRAAIQS